MKRIKAACIRQTLHFMLKEDIDQNLAARLVRDEVDKYKMQLDRNRVQYKILTEAAQPDGSVIIEILKQYNTSPVGHYLE